MLCHHVHLFIIMNFIFIVEVVYCYFDLWIQIMSDCLYWKTISTFSMPYKYLLNWIFFQIHNIFFIIKYIHFFVFKLFIMINFKSLSFDYYRMHTFNYSNCLIFTNYLKEIVLIYYFIAYLEKWSLFYLQYLY